MALARRLGFLSALRGSSWLLPDADLSECVFRRIRDELSRSSAPSPTASCAPLGTSWAPPAAGDIPRSLAPP